MKKYFTSKSFMIAASFLLLTACHRKFDYQSAYRFPSPKSYAENDLRPLEAAPLPSPHENPAELVSSTENEVLANDMFELRKVEKPMSVVTEKVKREKLRIRHIKKELQQGIKNYKKEIKGRQRLSTSDKFLSFEGATKGIVLVIIGLAIILAGVIIVNGTGVLIGSIVAAVGLVVFLWGLLGLLL